MGVHKAAIVERRLGEDCENFEPREDAKSGIFRVQPGRVLIGPKGENCPYAPGTSYHPASRCAPQELVRLKNAKSFGVLDFAIEVEL